MTFRWNQSERLESPLISSMKASGVGVVSSWLFFLRREATAGTGDVSGVGGFHSSHELALLVTESSSLDGAGALAAQKEQGRCGDGWISQHGDFIISARH
mmetsp:Transcript_19532/g.40778  ORF Transcript_19532/g.40778 Transcript_19532/m.40778 type:complete len:100 (-) Transcript_19532:31-330(-)